MNKIPERYVIDRCKLWPHTKKNNGITANFITQQSKACNLIITKVPKYDVDKDLTSYGMQEFHACLMASAQEMFEIVSAVATSNDLSFIRRRAKKILREIEAHREWLKDIYERSGF